MQTIFDFIWMEKTLSMTRTIRWLFLPIWLPILLDKTNNYLDKLITNIPIYYVLDFNSKAKEGVEIMPCSVCEVSFKHLKHQTEHVKYCGKKFKCTEFGKSFKSKQALVAHLNGHMERFKCQRCSKCLGSTSKLARHEASHGLTEL